MTIDIDDEDRLVIYAALDRYPEEKFTESLKHGPKNHEGLSARLASLRAERAVSKILGMEHAGDDNAIKEFKKQFARLLQEA